MRVRVSQLRRVIREVLTEGRRLDALARTIVKGLMPVWKAKLEDALLAGGRQTSVIHQPPGGPAVKVNTYLSPGASKDAWVSQAGFKSDGSIGIELVVRPKESAYSSVVEELVYSIRHELEHSDQFASGDTEKTAGLPMEDYLTHRKEVPAWVRSAMLKAKRSRRPLSVVLRDIAREDRIPDEVLDTWEAWARKRWPGYS